MKKVAGRPRRSAAWANLRKYTVDVEYTKLPAARTFFELYGAQAAIEELNRLLVITGHVVSLPKTQQELVFGKAVDAQAEQNALVAPVPRPPPMAKVESVFEVAPAPMITAPSLPIAPEPPQAVSISPAPSGRRSILDLDE